MRKRYEYGNDEFAAFSKRILAAFARRIATGDIEGLRDLSEHAQAAEAALGAAARALVAEGFSWADVGRVLDTTRQAAYQRFGQRHRRMSK